MGEAQKEQSDKVETGRLEALSDGVFAVAITLLALNLTVPAVKSVGPGHSLVNGLLDQWPEYVAYGLSFVTILIMWINHHNLFRLIKRTDHVFLILNGLLLMVIAVIPFVTAMLADYIQEPDKKTAQVVYSATFLIMALTYNVMWRYASKDLRLLDADGKLETVKSINRQYVVGPPLYLLAVVLAFISAEASLALCIVLAVFFGLPSSVTRTIRSHAGRA